MHCRLLFVAPLVTVSLLAGSVVAQELPQPRVLPPSAADPGLPPPRVLPSPRYLQPLPPRLLPLVPPGPRVITMPGGATYLVKPRLMMPPPPPYAYYRPSAYQVWQYYGVTYSGYFRPIVINTNNSGFYLYRGLPYPWVNNYPENQIMPFPMP